jgi:HSP20 family molecular chaperone IbpA
MLNNNSLSKMVDDIFNVNLWQLNGIVDDFYVQDSVKFEKDGSTTITIFVPGYSREDLDLKISESRLFLSSNKEDKKKISRTWKISDIVDKKNIKAECKNGILTITLRVAKENDIGHKIDIK